MRVIAKAAGEIICVISAALILLAAIMFLTGSKPAVVLSGSMEPTIKTGSIVIIDTKYKEPKEQDIVAFEQGGAMVVHRLVSQTEEGWITRGDANRTDDPWRVQDKDIKGRTVFWVPKLGYLIRRGA